MRWKLQTELWVRWATANNPSITFINYEQQQNRKQTSNKVWRLHAEQEQILTPQTIVCLVIADTAPNSKNKSLFVGALCVWGIRYSEQRLQPQSSFIVVSHNKLTSHNTTNGQMVACAISNLTIREKKWHPPWWNIRPSCIFTHQIYAFCTGNR